MNERLIIVKSVTKDIPCTKYLINEVVSVHLNAFPEFFLSTLGRNFLNAYYKCFAKHPNGTLLVAMQDEEVVAFAAATSVCRGFNATLLTNNLFCFGWCFMKLLFTNPMAIVRLGKNLNKKSSKVEDNEECAELYSIGISNEIQGKGIGSELMQKMELCLKGKGVKQVSLTTDYVDNEKTIGFYKKNGYEVLYEFVTYPNRRMYRLIKNL